jgi:RNA polymerase sigma-70 factor (ECF subfamily)
MQAALIPNLRPGNDSDFDALYQGAYRSVYRLCLAILCDVGAAEDCAQDVFVRAYRAWARWQPDAPAEVWLHRIAVNTARSHRRRRLFREMPATLDQLPSGQKASDSTVDLVGALKKLPRDAASALVLRLHDGFSVPEVAVMLGISERTVRNRVRKGREQLAKILGESDPEFEMGATVAVRPS